MSLTESTGFVSLFTGSDRYLAASALTIPETIGSAAATGRTPEAVPRVAAAARVAASAPNSTAATFLVRVPALLVRFELLIWHLDNYAVRIIAQSGLNCNKERNSDLVIDKYISLLYIISPPN